MKPTFTITRLSETAFKVVTDTMMTDGTYLSDCDMRLVGNLLKSHEEAGSIRIGGLMKLTLGQVSLPIIQALQVNQSTILS